MARRLIKSGPTEPCEKCGTSVRVSQYEGSQPRLNRVDNGQDMPGGHTPALCQDEQNKQR
jgi:hypothetical protein